MKYIYLILISFIFTGCYSCRDSNGNVPRASIFRTLNDLDLVDLNFERLSNLSVGLTKEQTLKIMGTENYTCSDIGKYITIDNPKSTEIIVENDRTFEVLHYKTLNINNVLYKDDCPPWEESGTHPGGTRWYRITMYNSLRGYTPLVFENGKLIGWGKCFLRSISKEYDNRFYEHFGQ